MSERLRNLPSIGSGDIGDDDLMYLVAASGMDTDYQVSIGSLQALFGGGGGSGIPQGGPLTEPLNTDGHQLTVAGDGGEAYIWLRTETQAPGFDAVYGTLSAQSVLGNGQAYVGVSAVSGEDDLEAASVLLSLSESPSSQYVTLRSVLEGPGVMLRSIFNDGEESAEDSLLLAAGDGATVTHDELPYTGPLPVAQSLSTDAPVIRAFATITQTDYDALDPPDANTLYVIVEVA